MNPTSFAPLALGAVHSGGIAWGAAGALAAAGGIAWGAVSPRSELFGAVVRHTSSAKKLALTFDDGPNPAATARLLDLLGRHSARATFFAIGKFARTCPDLVREIAARGHALGNHSENHANMFFLTPARIREELQRCQQAIADATKAEPPRWMRPPYGYRSPLLQPQLRAAGLRGMVMWSKICQDWKPQPKERLIRKLKFAENSNGRGEIVVLHDGDHRGLGANRDYLLAALEHWLPRWRDAGMEFVTIEAA